MLSIQMHYVLIFKCVCLDVEVEIFNKLKSESKNTSCFLKTSRTKTFVNV